MCGAEECVLMSCRQAHIEQASQRGSNALIWAVWALLWVCLLLCLENSALGHYLRKARLYFEFKDYKSLFFVFYLPFSPMRHSLGLMYGSFLFNLVMGCFPLVLFCFHAHISVNSLSSLANMWCVMIERLKGNWKRGRDGRELTSDNIY